MVLTCGSGCVGQNNYMRIDLRPKLHHDCAGSLWGHEKQGLIGKRLANYFTYESQQEQTHQYRFVLVPDRICPQSEDDYYKGIVRFRLEYFLQGSVVWSPDIP